MSLYDDLKLVAQDVMGQFKQGEVSLLRVTSGEGDEVWEVGDEEITSYGLDAAVRGVAKQYIDGTLVLADDLQVTCSTRMLVSPGVYAEIEPALTDLVVIDGAKHAIKKINKSPGAGTVIAWMIFVKGSPLQA